MITADLLERLRQLDVRLWAEGDRLRFNAPEGILTAELRSELAARKREIIEVLSKPESVDHQSPASLAPSFNQLPLWFHQQMYPGSVSYNIQRSVRLRGHLRIEILEQCLNKIVHRHDSLRTTFKAVDGNPCVVVLRALPVELAIVDLREAGNRGDGKSDIEWTIAQEVGKPFDLEHGPLFRFKLVVLGKDDHVLIITVHHIIADGSSMSVLYQELSLLYEAARTGTPSQLPEPPCQYPDYANWQRRWVQSEEFEQQLNFWERELRAAPYFLDLPIDYQRPAVHTFRAKGHSLVLSEVLTQGLKLVSRQEGTTLFVTLLAAFNTLLFRYTRQEDILVGSPFACRTSKEIEPLIGYFVNAAVFRTDLAGNPSFRELLRRIKQKLPGVLACQRVPFEKLVERLQPGRSLSHTPIFQVLFNLLNFAEERLQISGVEVEYLAPQHHESKFDLTLTAIEKNQRLRFSVGYNADLFATNTIERMLQHFRILFEGIVQNPDGKITRLPLLTDQELKQLVASWKGSISQNVSDRCIHQLFESQAERTPGAIAVIHEDNQLSYQELNQRSNQLAHFLKKLGIGPDRMVGICIDRSPEMVVALLGVLKAGGAYLPLDPNYPVDRLTFMIQDAGVRLLLAQQTVAASLSQLPLRILALDSEWNTTNQESLENPVCETSSENLAYLIYTSGSTGRSKGVEISHRALANFSAFACLEYEITQTDRVLQFASISFDAAVEEIFPCLTQGATLVLRTGAMLDSVPDFLARCRDWRLTVLDLPTAYWHELTLQVTQDRLAIPADLRLVIIGGEAADPERLAIWRSWASDRIRLINTYGPTESTVVSTFCDLNLPVEGGSKQRRHVPIGGPITNVQAYLLDTDLQPAPIGVPGEIYLGGDGLARGYHNCPELTAEKFVPNPFSGEPGARLYRTGDLARYGQDGNLEFLGRADRQVKVRGYRIELGEIEATLTQHPTVRQAVAVLREDLPGDKRLVAYVVAGARETIRTSELQQFLKSRLPAYMVPSIVIPMTTLPLTPSGKLERTTLPVPVSNAVHKGDDSGRRTPIEEIIADIWSQVLAVATVGRYDNFFDLGGHSLLATRVVSRVREAFGIDLPVRHLFEFQTLASLSEQVEVMFRHSKKLDIPPLTAGRRGNSIPLSYVQQRFWLLDQLEPGNPFYNVHIGIRMCGPLVLEALQRALEAIVQRHEMLRTHFASMDGVPEQVINSVVSVPLPVIDLARLSEAQREAEAARLAKEEARRPFDLSRGPLLRTTLLRLADEQNILLLIMHHIVADGWSVGVFYRELVALYEAFCSGQSASLSDLPIQYADYAVWQRQWLQNDVLETQLSYWRKQLEGAPKLFEMPTDYPRPAIQQFHGNSRPVVLPAELTEALKALGRRQGATLFMTLMAAFQALLYRYAGQEDVVVGTPIAGRNHIQTENVIGPFVNVLVLRTSISGDPSFSELLATVRKNTLDAYSHPDVPFERLVETLQLKRSLSYNPLFQVMFVLQNVPTSPVELAGLALSPFRVDKGTSKFDLSLVMVERNGVLGGELSYNTDLFSESTISRMADHFQSLLEAIVAMPEDRLSRLQMLSDVEWHRMRIELNRSHQEFDGPLCIHELFESQVERTSDATAVVEGSQELTYRKLNNRANQLARSLRARGIGPESRVAIYSEPSITMIVGLLGILKAGAAYIHLDPAWPIERIHFVLRDANAGLLLTESSLAGKLLEFRTPTLLIDHLPEPGSDTQNFASGVNPGNLASVVYTSGSSGEPNGISIEHRSLANYTLAAIQRYALRNSDRVLQFASARFDASLEEIFPCLTRGGTLVLRTNSKLDSVSVFSRGCEHDGITVLSLPTAYWQEFVDAMEAENLTLPSKLRLVIIGGETALPNKLATWQRRVGGKVGLWNTYGSCEATMVATAADLGKVNPDFGKVPIGRVIANVKAYVLDRFAHPVRIGVLGELYLSGVALARGYMDRPELTAEKFLPDPFEGELGARLFRTGDIVRYLPNGELDFVGRSDRQVKIRGFRVEPAEIEKILATSPAVRQAVVLAREDRPGDKRLVGYIVPSEPSSLDCRQVNEFLRRWLPGHMTLSALVILDAMPLTVTGKVDWRALPAPATDNLEQKPPLEEPASPVEQLLSEIWSQVLAVETVSPQDNFFEVGGHSLLATRLVSRVRSTFGIEFPLRSVFEKPTVREMAAVIVEMKLNLADPEDISRILTELSEERPGTSLFREISPKPA